MAYDLILVVHETLVRTLEEIKYTESRVCVHSGMSCDPVHHRGNHMYSHVETTRSYFWLSLHFTDIAHHDHERNHPRCPRRRAHLKFSLAVRTTR